ncbi:MAG: 6,7-dimethyl-8-ribityllumazine synthase [Candidatus Melainabacteria bacterium]|nr:6,7-dimethyl-8-ribityllumazine synthase [Candidatus Melainabacteria bacterium]
MPRIISAQLVATQLRFAIVVSRFNEFITSRLLSACMDTLVRHGADDMAIDVIWCPGAYEIPFVARQMAQTDNYNAVICLGAIIRGATPHFDYVAGQCAKGIAHVALETGVPTIFGVITSDTIEQAVERAGTKAGNKGADAALAAIEMANLMQEMVSCNARNGRGAAVSKNNGNKRKTAAASGRLTGNRS